MIINLNEYRAARAQKQLAQPREEEELLCVNWNPAFGIVALSCFRTPQELSPQLPDDFEGIDMPAFIERLQSLASQI
jgi:hypothetical protein